MVRNSRKHYKAKHKHQTKINKLTMNQLRNVLLVIDKGKTVEIGELKIEV